MFTKLKQREMRSTAWENKLESRNVKYLRVRQQKRRVGRNHGEDKIKMLGLAEKTQRGRQ